MQTPADALLQTIIAVAILGIPADGQTGPCSASPLGVGVFSSTPGQGNAYAMQVYDDGDGPVLFVGGTLLDTAGATPGREYFNIFSNEPCAGGSGPYLGSCATNLDLILAQLAVPAECPPLHFIATHTSPVMGRWIVPPATYQGVCLDVTGASIGSVSAVFTTAIQ